MHPVLFTLLSAAVTAAVPPKQLIIEHPAIHQYEDGPDLAASFRFASGETVFLDFQIGGYQRSEDDNIKLSWTVQVQDPTGLPVIAPQSGDIATQLSQEDKNWLPKARVEILIPPHAPSGTYKVLMAAKDALAGTSATRELTFQVHGHAWKPSDTLAIQDVGFFRSEEDAKALQVPAYRPGDVVWVRFDIVGFKLGEGNKFDVGYGIAVLRANGEAMLNQPEGAAEKGDPFYPQRYVPAGFSFTLDKDIRPGEYTVVVTAQDRVGNQQAEVRQSFTVEQ